jgi:putative addiction module CopG family antidote
MHIRNINLTPDLDEFISARVDGGRYANIGELVQAALRALDREERTRDRERAEWRTAADEDCARRIAEIDVFRELWLNQHRSRAAQGSCAEPSMPEISPAF